MSVSVDPIHVGIRELLAENDRWALRNTALQRQLQQAQDRIAALEAGAAPSPLRPLIVLGRLKLDGNLRVLSLDERSIALTLRKADLLAYLMARPGRVISADALARALEHTDADAVRTLIYRVKPQLAEVGAERYLRTHSALRGGGGYYMTCDHEKKEQP